MHLDPCKLAGAINSTDMQFCASVRLSGQENAHLFQTTKLAFMCYDSKGEYLYNKLWQWLHAMSVGASK